MTITLEMVEAAAKAFYAAEYDIEHYPWESETPISREGYCRSARKALEAALAASQE